MAQMQNITWPAISVQATNPSVAPNGQSPSATSSTLVAGQDPSGDQQPLQTDASGNLLVSIDPSTQPFHVIVDSSALPDGAATEATLATLATEATVATLATEATLSSQAAVISSRLSGSLVPAAYDEVQLGYTGSNLTSAVYKLAGSTVRTLTLSYTGAQLDGVVAS